MRGALGGGHRGALNFSVPATGRVLAIHWGRWMSVDSPGLHLDCLEKAIGGASPVPGSPFD